jgi:TorA maturation chaperone TorD
MEKIDVLPVEAKDQSSLLLGQSLVLGLLGKLLYTYPEPSMLGTVLDDELYAEIPFGDAQADVISGLSSVRAWFQENMQSGEDELLEGLRADYTRLFVGPGRVLAPPWESVYFSKERLTFQEQTLQVRQCYARFGLQCEKLYNEPDDHIGLELAFTAHLSSLAAQAIERVDQKALADIFDAQRSFLSEHLLTWAAGWCAHVLQESRTGFYPGIALMVRGVLAELADNLGIEGYVRA